MALPRVIKSQRTSTSLAQSDKGVDEEMLQSESQSCSDDDQVTRLATEMQREARKRRDARRTVIINSYWEAVMKIEKAMTLKFEEITKRMQAYSNIYILSLYLIENRVKRHRLRVDRLNHLIQKRSAIEKKMFASSQNVENAFIYADKALAFAFGRRLQSIAKQQKAPTA